MDTKIDKVYVDTCEEYIDKLNEGYIENQIEITDPEQMNRLGYHYECGMVEEKITQRPLNGTKKLHVVVI